MITNQIKDEKVNLSKKGVAAPRQQQTRMRARFSNFMNSKQEGIGVIEIILILVIIIGLVLIFKDQISGIIEEAFLAITGDTEQIISK